MKKLQITILFLCFSAMCHAQLLREITEQIKETAKSKVKQKIDNGVNNAIDSASAGVKKAVKKKNKKEKVVEEKVAEEKPNEETNNSDEAATTNDNKSAATQSEGPTSKEGFITLELSNNKIFIGGSITINGESLVYKGLTDVEININGPKTNETKKIALDKDGKFTAIWNATKIGKFTVTLKSSDGKATEKETFEVYTMANMSTMANDVNDKTIAAEKKLEEAVEEIKPMLSSKDAQELDKKFKEIKDKVAALKKMHQSINQAGKELAAAQKKGSGGRASSRGGGNSIKIQAPAILSYYLQNEYNDIGENIRKNLTSLYDAMSKQANQMDATTKAANHKPFDNSVCEYLVIVNEACAAFSTFTNFYSKSMLTILKNITTDKVVPAATGTILNSATNSNLGDYAALPAKIYATPKIDAEGLVGKLGTAGFVGDMLSFTTSTLLKQYCGVMSGTVKQKYTCDFKNKDGEIWWSYGYKTEASITLRYPKSKGSGKIVNMKGNIEGNATKFAFRQDISKEDGWKEQQKKFYVPVIPLINKAPIAVPFAVNGSNDKLGFGAAARGLAVPANFNIPIDAIYDRDAGTIKIMMNPALIDFTSSVTNKTLFLVAAVLPMCKVQNFPIEKVYKTMNAVIKRSKGYKVKKLNGNLSFTDTDQFKVGGGSDEAEQVVNLIIDVKQE